MNAPGASRRGAVDIKELGRAADAGALAHYEDPAYYAKTYWPRQSDVEFYVALARENGGPVLEYGIGNGRVAIPIARAGVSIVGIDLSRPMLDDLAQRLEAEPVEVRRRVRAMHGDMRAARVRGRFPLVIAPFNALLHLYDRSDVERFLARVRDHLAPGGRFVFDVSVPQPEDLSRTPDRLYRTPRLRHPTRNEVVRYAERYEYDPVRQLLLVRIEFTPRDETQAWMVPLTHRQFFPLELEALLHYNGFADLEFSADFSSAPPDRNVDSLVVSAKLARRSPVQRSPGARGATVGTRRKRRAAALASRRRRA